MVKKLKFGVLCAVFLLLSFICQNIAPAQAYTISAAEAVFEVNSGRMLYSKNEREKLPPASTTKILTALIVIEDCNLDDSFSIPKECAGIEGSSIYLVAGEKLTVRDLLYGLMLRSGNDCAESLAVYHSGSVAAFSEVMNARAVALGAAESHFVNPHGLPCEGHYTTAHDLGLIAAQALRDPIFRKIVSARSWDIPDGGCGYARHLVNKNKMLSMYEGADGVKTGYTKQAGRCLVASSTRENMRLVSVVLNSPSMYERSVEILDLCYAKYSVYDLNSVSDRFFTLNTDVAKKTCRCEVETGNCAYPLTESEREEIRCEVCLPSILTLPVRTGQEVGELKIFLQNRLLFSKKIVSIENVEKSYFDVLDEVLEGF